MAVTVSNYHDGLVSRATSPRLHNDAPAVSCGVRTYAHDGNGRLSSETTPWSIGPVTYPYTPNGLRWAAVQPTGQITTYVYDVADQLLNQQGPTGALIATYTHNANGSNVTADIAGVGLTTYTWDAANRLQQLTFPDGHFRQNVYRADGLRHSNQTYSTAGSPVTQETTLWDHARAQSLAVQTAFGPGASAYQQDITTIAGAWKAAGIGADGYQIAGLMPNLPSYVGSLTIEGVISPVGYETTVQSNPSGSLTAAVYPSGDGRIASSWNPTGEPGYALTVSITITDGNIHRVGFYSAAFYPTAGETLQQTLTLIDPTSGSVLGTVVQSNYVPGVWSFFNITGTVWVTIEGNGSAPTTLSAIAFDPPTGSVGAAPLPQQQPAVLVQSPAAGMSGSINGISLLRSVALPGAGTTLGAGGSGGSFTDPSRQYHVDGLGTVLALTDASGVVTASYDADAFGASVSPGSQSIGGDPYSYLGGLGYWHDADAGLYYVRQRWLDPATGRWLSVDPVEGEPRYSYANNAPTTGVDPSGNQSLDNGSQSTITDLSLNGNSFGVTPAAPLAGPVSSAPPSSAESPQSQAASVVLVTNNFLDAPSLITMDARLAQSVVFDGMRIRCRDVLDTILAQTGVAALISDDHAADYSLGVFTGHLTVAQWMIFIANVLTEVSASIWSWKRMTKPEDLDPPTYRLDGMLPSQARKPVAASQTIVGKIAAVHGIVNAKTVGTAGQVHTPSAHDMHHAAHSSKHHTHETQFADLYVATDKVLGSAEQGAVPIHKSFPHISTLEILKGGAILYKGHIDVDTDGSWDPGTVTVTKYKNVPTTVTVVRNGKSIPEPKMITTVKHGKRISVQATHRMPVGTEQVPADANHQSITSLVVGRSHISLDANTIHYVVLSGYFFRNPNYPDLEYGDIAAVIYRGRVAFAIIADGGPHKKLGEGSVALLRALGEDRYANGHFIDSDIPDGVVEILFPGSRRLIDPHGRGSVVTAPLTQDHIDSVGAALFSSQPGIAYKSH
jgi:RHS repeat-associated protein